MNQDIEFDEYCDPNNPRKIKYDDILSASRRIVGAVIRTPCTERGARNVLLTLSEEQKKYGVITASTGNHGIAMSYHASLLGVPCVVVMPIVAAIIKVNKCEQFGAKIILNGNNIAEAKLHAMTIGKEKRMSYINGYDHPNIVEGQGSIGIEIIEQVPAVDAILIPVGGGSLLCGVAIAAKNLKPDTEVYGIETDKTCSMVEALRKNERIRLDIGTTIADALAVNMVGVNTFHNVKGFVDKMIVVKEDWMVRAIMHIVEEERFVVEGGGAVTIAAIMAGLFPNLKGKNVHDNELLETLDMSDQEAQDMMATDPGNVKRWLGLLARGRNAEAQEYAFLKALTPSTVAVKCFDSASGGVSVHDHDLNPSITESMPNIFSAEAGARPSTSGVTATPVPVPRSLVAYSCD